MLNRVAEVQVRPGAADVAAGGRVVLRAPCSSARSPRRGCCCQSVQERFVVCWNVTAGFEIVYCASLFAACRYLLKLAFTDVFPLPNTS